jgi:hypothetical protein
VTYYSSALSIHREIRDRWGEGVELANLGSAHAHLHNFAEARQVLDQALAAAREVNAPVIMRVVAGIHELLQSEEQEMAGQRTSHADNAA